MTLIVEDGSIVSGANSYNDLPTIRAYALARGVTLSSADAQVEAISFSAMDYFESFSTKFKGGQVSRDQPLSFPRVGLVVDGWSWTSTEIPTQVKDAHLALIVEISRGEDPFNPSVAQQNIISEKVGPIQVDYSQPNFISKTTKSLQSSVYIGLLLASANGKISRA